VGRRVRILGATFGVVGVAAPLRSRKAGRDDAFVLVPRETLRSLAGRDERVEIAVLADAPENLADLSDAIRDSLRRLHGLRSSDRDDFRVETQASLAAAADTMVSVLTVAMLMSCLLALSVAGIGVMNVMLIAVKERTREIGLRLAVGASRRQITVQFVTEAATLGVTGAVSGLAAGVAAAAWIAKGMDSALSVPAWGVACGVLAATGTAMVSGIVPAVRASRLTPAAALAADEMSSWPSSEEPTSLRLGSHR
jgi:putative ABC transport system permease protein